MEIRAVDLIKQRPVVEMEFNQQSGHYHYVLTSTLPIRHFTCILGDTKVVSGPEKRCLLNLESL